MRRESFPIALNSISSVAKIAGRGATALLQPGPQVFASRALRICFSTRFFPFAIPCLSVNSVACLVYLRTKLCGEYISHSVYSFTREEIIGCLISLDLRKEGLRSHSSDSTRSHVRAVMVALYSFASSELAYFLWI